MDNQIPGPNQAIFYWELFGKQESNVKNEPQFVIYPPPKDSLPFLAARIQDGRVRALYVAQTQRDADGAVESLERDFRVCEFYGADIYPYGTEHPRLSEIVEQLKNQGYPVP